LSGKFATWAGTFLTVGTPLAIAAETKDQVDEAFMRLARVGLETVTAYVIMDEYEGEANEIKQPSVAEVAQLVENMGEVQLIDVRQPGEYATAHASAAINFPLNTLGNNIDALDPTKPTYAICQTGYRSSLATSLLENAGFKSVYNVTGGTSAWIEAKLPTEQAPASCPV
jgi:hydroxyacylglutathione hydrolase